MCRAVASPFPSYEDLWGKVVDGLLQVNASDADWFVKVDDDTFLLYPNLLELLAPLDPAEPVYLGLSLVYRPEVGGIKKSGNTMNDKCFQEGSQSVYLNDLHRFCRPLSPHPTCASFMACVIPCTHLLLIM